MKRVALVTGANRGIGFEICRQLGAAGYTVVLTARDPDKGARAVRTLRRDGIEAHSRMLDVTQPDSAREAAGFVAGELGRLDALVNNAAIAIDPDEVLETLDLDVMRRTLDTNLLGVLACCQAFLPLMKQQGYGRIVNVSSGRGSFTKLGAGGPCYRISKTALNALTVILADEVKEHNILVNAVTPGWVRTRRGGMKQQGYGRIVNVSSGRGSFSKLGAGGPCYRISKTALNALTVILADEVKEHNILVNAVTPGWVRTRLGGMKAPRSTAEGAEAAVWLAMLPDDGPRGKFFKDREEFPW